MAQVDVRSNSAFTGQSQRCNLSTTAIRDIDLTTTAKIVWTVDSAEIGAVNACLTILNSGSVSITLTAFVCNDLSYIASNAGRVTLSELYSEADASIGLPLTITAGSTDHVILGYKNQPMLTTFRFWNFLLASASATATCSIFGNAH